MRNKKSIFLILLMFIMIHKIASIKMVFGTREIKLIFPESNQKRSILRASDWENIRNAYIEYTGTPTTENAQQLLAVLPNDFDNLASDLEQWSPTLKFFSEKGPFRVLERLIRQGDELAIRIAFKTTVITDGYRTEELGEIISESIRANPKVFLEESKASIKQDSHLLHFILRRDADINTYTLYDDPQAREEFNKEILLRMKSLKTVTRPDLIEIRDYCLRRYKRLLEEGK